ncbi:MAG: hypothetical protein WC421_08580 [Elusimicrobiales bacterium]
MQIIFALYILAVAPLAAGSRVLELVYPARGPEDAGAAFFRLCAAFAAGLGILSLFHFCWLLSAPGAAGFYPPAEIALAAFCLPPLLRVCKNIRIGFSASSSAVAAALAGALGAAVIICLINPHSGFDAWAFWNLRARIFYLEPQRWAELFSVIDWRPNHNNMPFLPLLTARGWALAGSCGPALPCAQSVIFAAGLCALLFAALRKSGGMAAIAAIALLGGKDFAVFASSQKADMPFSLFALAAFVLAAEERGALAAGFFAGLAFWTKTEGVLLAGALAAVMAADCLKAGKSPRERLFRFAAGALPFACAASAFKWFYSAQAVSYLTVYPPMEMLVRAGRLAKALFIAPDGMRWYELLTLLLLAALARARGVKTGFQAFALAAVCALALCYCAAILCDAAAIDVVINNGAYRALAQLRPLFIFACLY